MREKRVRIKYSKRYPANLIGHLDVVMSLQRSMRMSSWPFWFTQGYNPRIKISFSPSLSLGFSSFTEYMDVSLSKDLEEFHISEFSASTIEGIDVRDIKVLDENEPGINDVIEGFRYKVESTDDYIELDEKLIPAVELKNNYIVIDIFKENGGFKNPLKYFKEGNYNVTKINCHFKRFLLKG